MGDKVLEIVKVVELDPADEDLWSRVENLAEEAQRENAHLRVEIVRVQND
jgi:hypothetical protein